jgi:hypothetical protein
MISMQQVNTLGQLIDTTFGKSSTTSAPTVSIKMVLQGNSLIVKYTTLVHFASEQSMREQSKELERAAVQLTKKTIDNVVSEFKKIEGKTLKATKKSTDNGIELISMSPYNPRKVAYYRFNTTYEIDV